MSSDNPGRPHGLFSDHLRSPASGLHTDGVLRDFRFAVQHLSNYDLWRAQQKRKSQLSSNAASSSSSSSSSSSTDAAANGAKRFGSSFVDYDEQLMAALNARGLSMHANEVRAYSAQIGDGQVSMSNLTSTVNAASAAGDTAASPFMFATMGKDMEHRMQRFWSIPSLVDIADLSVWLMNTVLHSYAAWDDAIKANVHPITIGIGGQHDFVHNVFLSLPEELLAKEPLPQPGEFYNHPFMLATPQYPIYTLPSEYSSSSSSNGGATTSSSLEKEFIGVFVSNAFLFMIHWFNLLVLSQPLTAESPMEARIWACQQVRTRIVQHLRQVKALKARLLDAFEQMSNGQRGMPPDLNSISYAAGVMALDNAFAHWLIRDVLSQILWPFSLEEVSTRALQVVGGDASKLPLTYPTATLLRGAWPVTQDPNTATAENLTSFNANEACDVAWLSRVIGCNYAIDFDFKTTKPISPEGYCSAANETITSHKALLTALQKTGLIKYHCMSMLWCCMRRAIDACAPFMPFDYAKLMMYCMNTSPKPGAESDLVSSTASSSSATDDPEVQHVSVADTYQLGMTSAQITLETSGKSVSALETSPLIFLSTLSIKLVLSGGAIALAHYNCQMDESQFHARVYHMMEQYAKHLIEVPQFGKFGKLFYQTLFAELNAMRRGGNGGNQARQAAVAAPSPSSQADPMNSTLQQKEFAQLLNNAFNILPSEAQEQHEAKVFEFVEQLKAVIAFGVAHARPEDVTAVDPNNFITLIDRFSGLGWMALEANLCTNWQETMKPNMVVFDNLHALFKARRDFDRFVASQCRSSEDLAIKTYCNMSIAQNYAMITERMSTARVLITCILSSLQSRWDAKFNNKSMDILALGLFYFDQFANSTIFDPAYQNIFGFMELVASLNRLSREIYYTNEYNMRLIEQFSTGLQQMLTPILSPDSGAFQDGEINMTSAMMKGPAMFNDFMKCLSMFDDRRSRTGGINVYLMHRVLKFVTHLLEDRTESIMLKANAMLENPVEETVILSDMEMFKTGLHSSLAALRDFLSMMAQHIGSSQRRLKPEVFEEYGFSDDDDVLLEEDMLHNPNDSDDDGDVIF